MTKTIISNRAKIEQIVESYNDYVSKWNHRETHGELNDKIDSEIESVDFGTKSHTQIVLRVKDKELVLSLSKTFHIFNTGWSFQRLSLEADSVKKVTIRNAPTRFTVGEEK